MPKKKSKAKQSIEDHLVSQHLRVDWDSQLRPDRYQNDIEETTRMVASKKTSHEVPVLHKRSDPPKKILDVHFAGERPGMDDDNELIVRFRFDVLYVIGFKNFNGWWEFKGGKLIAGSKELGFDENYLSMQKKMGIEMRNLKLSRNHINKAIGGLRGYHEKIPDKIVAEWISVVIIFIAEAIRFWEVHSLVIYLLENKEKIKKLDEMIDLLRNFSDISMRLQEVVKDSNEQAEVDEAKKKVRIMLDLTHKIKIKK